VTEQSWEKGQEVLVFGSPGRLRYDQDYYVRVVEIESVAPKSFVAAGYRFFKDKLQVRNSSGYGTTMVAAMDDERAPYLLACREASQRLTAVSTAELAWKRERTVNNAADLQVELHGWVVAVEKRDKVREELRALRGGESWTRGLLDR
jgi:hypothetical protein